MTELQNILDKYNFPKRATKPLLTFEEIEFQIGFSLPADYKFFLDNYSNHEEFVGPELVNLWDADELLIRNKETHLSPLQIEKVKELLLEEKTKKGLLITDHMYRQVLEICDDLYILANGKTHLAKSFTDIETLGYAKL